MPKTSRRGAIDHLFSNNKAWVDSILKTDPDYFAKWASSQAPKYFWLGCADSRVVAEACTGLKVGDLFVHRNVGNILSHTDVNGMSALEYSVKSLGVQHVLVCGHTNCGAVNAALRMPSKSQGITNCWISQIRTTRNEHAAEIAALPRDQQVLRLVKLNVLQQVFNVCTSPVLQQAWDAGQDVHVHGLLYDVATGSLELLVGPISSNAEVPEDDPGEFANVTSSKKSLGAALESMMLKTDSQSQLGEASMHSHHMRKASVVSSDVFNPEDELDLSGDKDNAAWLQHLASGVGKAQTQEKQRLAKAINSHIAFESVTGSFDPPPAHLMHHMGDHPGRNGHMHNE